MLRAPEGELGLGVVFFKVPNRIPISGKRTAMSQVN